MYLLASILYVNTHTSYLYRVYGWVTNFWFGGVRETPKKKKKKTTIIVDLFLFVLQIMEQQMLEEMERKRVEQLEEEKRKKVRKPFGWLVGLFASTHL